MTYGSSRKHELICVASPPPLRTHIHRLHCTFNRSTMRISSGRSYGLSRRIRARSFRRGSRRNREIWRVCWAAGRATVRRQGRKTCGGANSLLCHGSRRRSLCKRACGSLRRWEFEKREIVCVCVCFTGESGLLWPWVVTGLCCCSCTWRCVVVRVKMILLYL